MPANTPKPTPQYAIVLLALLCLARINTYAQNVTPWMTTGDKSKLLQQQGTVSFGANSGSNPSTVTVTPGTTYQSVDALGFCLTEGSAEVINGLSSTTQNTLLTELFSQSGIGISAIRISIGASDLSSSDYTYDESPGDVNMNNFSLAGPDLTYLIPIIKKALAINPNIKILATPWTAPTWMKTNSTWVGGSLNTAYYAAYARYFVKYIQAMQAQGISIWAITPQNEPLNPNNNPSMSMSSTEEKNFINNNLGPALASAGLGGVRIIAYDHNCDNTAYPIDVCNNSSYVDGAAFHLYAGSISAMTTVKNSTGKNVYFTEQFTSSTGSFSGDFGWHIQNVVNGSVNNWSKSVFEWNLANNTSMGPHTSGGCTTCLGAYTINSSTSYTRNVAYYIIGQLSKFVRPGALRIASSSSSSGLSVSAFKNPDGSIATLVYNSGASATSMKLVSGTQALTYSIPAASAVTFVWTPGSAPVTSFPGYYNILARSSGKGLDVADNATTSGARLQQYDVTGGGGSNQRWSFTPAGNGNYYIKVKSTQMCMAPSAQGTVDGEKVQQRTCGTSGEFQWTVTSLGTGYYKVVNANSGKSLDVQDNSLLNGANIQVWAYTGANNQQWQFVQVETTTGARLAAEAVPADAATMERAITVYPNPAHDYVTVSDGDGSTNQLELCSMKGSVLLTRRFTGETRLDISRLARGVYIIKITGKDGTVYRKFSRE